MNSSFATKLPTIYADMNVYRYVACGDMSINDPDRFIWVYSHVHLDEIQRNGNKDALEGMKLLRAVELCDVLNEKFQSVGELTLRDYIDPYESFAHYLNITSDYKNIGDYMVEHLIRSFGADNFKELSKAPYQLREEIERLTSDFNNKAREEILKKVSVVSEEMSESIEKHFKIRMPIDKTRNAFGVTSQDRKKIEKSHSPIDDVWDLISPTIPNITKNQFFGFEPIPGIKGVQHTQNGAISGAYIILNMLGINPDEGLAKREKIKNIISDSQHAGMASYCNVLVSADRAFTNKARCIYTYLGIITNILYFDYQKGYVLNLVVEKT
jgi:nitrogen regulatory protein PII-like uncharacterized protein